MKKLLLAVMAMLLFSCSSDDTQGVSPQNTSGQVCTNIFRGNALLRTQAEVDAFAAHNYCSITGALRIGSMDIYEGEDIIRINSDITSIQGLSSIKSVNNNIYVVDNPKLNSLKGLQNIENVGGSVFITGNPLIISLEGLEGITIVGFVSSPTDIVDTGLYVNYNESLTSLNGLGALKVVGQLEIQGNNALYDLKGLERIETAIYSLYIKGNKSLVSLDGLSGLKSAAYVSIHECEKLVSLNGMTALRSSNMIDIAHNASLQTLDGLETVTEINEFLSIYGNVELNNLCAIKNIVPLVESVTIQNNFYNPTKEDIIAGNCSQ